MLSKWRGFLLLAASRTPSERRLRFRPAQIRRRCRNHQTRVPLKMRLIRAVRLCRAPLHDAVERL